MFSPRRAAHIGLVGVVLLLLTSLGVLVAYTLEQKTLPEVRLGRAVPDFQLQDLSGKEVLFSSLPKRVTVIFFTTPDNPVTELYRQRVAQLAEQYGKDSRMQVVVVYTTDEREGDVEEIRSHVALAKPPFPVLVDPRGQMARLFDVRFTPTFFVTDAEGVLCYSGAFDDNQKPDQVKNHYCEDVVRRLLDSGAWAMASTHAFGNAQRPAK